MTDRVQFILRTYAEKERARRRADLFRRWRNRLLAALLIVLLIVLVAVAGYNLWRML